MLTSQQARADLAGDVAWLYMQGMSHAAIGVELELTVTLVHKTLTCLFAEGMPKRDRLRASPQRVQAIHGAYVRGDGSLSSLARLIGLTSSGARRRMSELGLVVGRQMPAGKPARSPAHAEQRVITALLKARVDELRSLRGLSLECLANVSGVSMWTVQQLRSEFSDPRLTTVLRLCRGLGVRPGELLDDLPLPTTPRPRRPRATTGRPNRR